MSLKEIKAEIEEGSSKYYQLHPSYNQRHKKKNISNQNPNSCLEHEGDFDFKTEPSIHFRFLFTF